MLLNQKGTRPQDKPKPLGTLSADDQQRIFARYPELKALVVEASAASGEALIWTHRRNASVRPPSTGMM